VIEEKLIRRLGINLLYLVPGAVGGSEIYGHRLLSAIRTVEPELELVVYCAPEAASSLSRHDVTLRPAPSTSAVKPLRALVEQTWLPGRARADRVELLHSLGTTGPVLGRVPSVVTVLDLIFHHFPQTFPAGARLGLEAIVPRAARHARRVIAISEFAASDIATNLGIDRGKIDVVQLGPGSPPAAQFTPEAILRERMHLAGDIVLCVSAALAHKNLLRLIDAFTAVPGAVLVLVGHGGRGAAELKACAAGNGIADRVTLTGWIEQPDLEGLYRAA
jgi:glycosyltransferase involved in cell wall biosynthesis